MIKRFFIIMLSVFLIGIALCGCRNEIIGGYTHPEFITSLTVEEHIANITKRTREKYAENMLEEGMSLLDEEEILEGILPDEGIKYEGKTTLIVDIIYAFDGDPEYFLVEFEDFYISRDVGFVNAHIIGYIEKDCYKTGLYEYGGLGESSGIKYKESLYKLNDVMSQKKYYGARIQAVEKDGVIVGLNEEYENIEIPPSRFEYLVNGNFKLFPKNY